MDKELRAAVDDNDVEKVVQLLDAGANPNWKNEYGSTTLLAAFSQGNGKIIQLLIDRGASINEIDEKGINYDRIDYKTALHIAAKIGLANVVKILLENGADVNHEGSDFEFPWTPLHHAAAAGHLEVVKILLEGGAEVNPPDHGEYTPHSPLWWAENEGHSDVAAFLKSVGGKSY
jgi:ankyrin repeat protein